MGSAVVVPGLWSIDSKVVAHRPSHSLAYRICLNYGLNPCILHWQVVSLPLSHQGRSPPAFVFTVDGSLLLACCVLYRRFWKGRLIRKILRFRVTTFHSISGHTKRHTCTHTILHTTSRGSGKFKNPISTGWLQWDVVPGQRWLNHMWGNKYVINAEERLTTEQYDGFALSAFKVP